MAFAPPAVLIDQRHPRRVEAHRLETFR